MKKKLFILVLAFIMTCSSSLISLAVDSGNAESESNNNTTIIEQALALDETINLSGEDFTVISMTEENTAYSMRGQSSLALQSINETDGIVEVTTIHPYKVTADNELVSSFDYVPNQTRAGGQFTYQMVDTTVTVKVYYFQSALSSAHACSFYRPLGLEAYWNSSNSTVSVSNLYVKFESMGDLHEYPACMTKDLDTTLIQENYIHINQIDLDNPAKKEIRVSMDAMMDSDRVLDFCDGFNHGGIVRVEASYTVNGSAKTYGHSYNAYL